MKDFKGALLLGASLHLVLLTACLPRSLSHLNNTFSLDESNLPRGNFRRHAATAAEAVWGIDGENCGSAVLLDAQHLLTVAHCEADVGDKYTSGLRALRGDAPDLIVRKVLEQNTELDYMILEIAWLSPMPSEQKFPPYIALSPDELLAELTPEGGDTIFTVGYPADKEHLWPVTYAEGQLKYIDNSNLVYYDVGVINGNSGGPLLKKDNHLLLGLVTKGEKTFKDPGWNNNDVNDPTQWNQGTSTWAIYKVSPLLREIFPAGKHRDLEHLFVPRSRLYLAVEDTSEGYVVWLTAGHEAVSAIMCSTSSDACRVGARGAEKLRYQHIKRDRKFFRALAPRPDINGKTYSFQVFDNKGKLLARRRVTLKQRLTP